AMAGDYRSITEGLILVSTIVGWNWLLDWLSTKSPLIARLVALQPLLLIRNGRVHRENLRREMAMRRPAAASARAEQRQLPA
ncbi:MAG: DUF421 domain-containing protein, partial [Steroidobacteraceae bacterium]